VLVPRGLGTVIPADYVKEGGDQTKKGKEKGLTREVGGKESKKNRTFHRLK